MQAKSTPLISAAPGTQRTLQSWHYGVGQPGKVYIQAGLHADETPAMLTATRLQQRIAALEQQNLLASEIVIVPVANPIGLSQTILGQFLGRFEFGSGQNFNRQYPFLAAVGDRVAARLGNDPQANCKVIRASLHEMLDETVVLTEIDSLRLALMRLSIDADVVLDLHCSLEANLHLYTSEALWPQIEPLARYMEAETCLLSTDSGGDPFDEVHSRLWWTLNQRFGDATPVPHACVATTIELRGQRDVDYVTADRDADAIIAYLTARGAIIGQAPVAPPLKRPATPLAGSEQFYAPSGGILVHRVEVGAWIKAGDPLFDIVDPYDGSVTTIASHTEGVLYMRRAVRFTPQGAPLGRVSGVTVQRHGRLLSA